MRSAIQRANQQPMVPWAAGAALVAFLGTTAGQRIMDRVVPDHGPAIAQVQQTLAALDRDMAGLARACWKLGARGGSWTNRIQEDTP